MAFCPVKIRNLGPQHGSNNILTLLCQSFFSTNTSCGMQDMRPNASCHNLNMPADNNVIIIWEHLLKFVWMKFLTKMLHYTLTHKAIFFQYNLTVQINTNIDTMYN